MMNATSLDFIIYNIPQTTGYALSVNMLKEMMSFDQVIGVKNSSMPVQDIYLFKRNAGKEIVVFNGPDEQFVAGRIMGADAGIGGTYGVMPELFLAANQAIEDSEIEKAQEIQIMIDDIIFKMLEAKGNLYDVMKAVLVKRGITIGSVRAPLPRITSEDMSIVEEVYGMIELAIKKYSL